MDGLVRRDIVFSEHASMPLFECLIVAGAPATGLLQDAAFKDRNTLQTTLQVLRDMWQRVDRLYIPRADLESLHCMECISTTSDKIPIPDHIIVDVRKLSRYYVYLLFRYCMSSAGPTSYINRGFTINQLSSMSQREVKSITVPLVDIPGSWLETKVCTNCPSAPPMPEGSSINDFPNCTPQQPPQRQPRSIENRLYVPHQLPRQPITEVRDYHGGGYVKQQDGRIPLQRNTNHSDTTICQFSQRASQTRHLRKPTSNNVTCKGCYNSDIDSED